ncbi:MAG: extracellular solute-binding protein [Christensenellales bacterium]|jgi:putative aldouronate transport system substrate-binding protein
MRSFFKLICLVLIAAMTLCACSSPQATTPTGGGQAASTSGAGGSGAGGNSAESAKPEPAQISMVMRVSAAYMAENNPVLEAIQESANVKLDIELPPQANYNDRVSIIMASNDLPDLIFFFDGNTPNYRNYARDGLLIAVDDYIENYSNLMEKANVRGILSHAFVPETGFHHAIPRPHIANDWGIMVRNDWFEKLDMEYPSTPEEFIECARRIAKEDPDGNGKDDTYGTIISPPNLMVDSIISGFDLGHPLYTPDGKVTLRYEREGYLKLLDFYRQMYEDGSLEPEFYLTKSTVETERFRAGQIGMNIHNMRARDMYMFTEEEAAFPGFDVEFLPPLKDENGQITLYGAASTWGIFSVTSHAKEPEKVFEFMNWGMSQEGQVLMVVGLEGITHDTYNIDNGMITYVDDQLENNKKWVSTHFSFGYVRGDGSPLITWGRNNDEADELKEYNAQYDSIVDKSLIHIEGLVDGVSDAKSTMLDMDNSRLENEIKYILGQMSRSEFEKFLNEVYLPAANDTIKTVYQNYVDGLK